MDPEELTLERQWLYTAIAPHTTPIPGADLERLWASYQGSKPPLAMCEIWRIIEEIEDLAQAMDMEIPASAIEEFVARQIWRDKLAIGIEAFASPEIGELLIEQELSRRNRV